MFVSVGKGPICYGFHGNQLNYLTYGQYQYIGCNLLCWKGWECKTYMKLKTMCTNMQMICKLANNVHWLCSLCVVIGRRCYAATSIAFALNMSSQNAVVMLQRPFPLLLMYRHRTPLLCCNVNCICSNMSSQDAVFMMQRQLPLLFMCRHRTPLLCCNVNCICS